MEILILFIVAIGFWFLGAHAGWRAREKYTMKITQNILKNIEESVEKELELVIKIKIEKDKGILYVYNKEDNTFMAQGSNQQELEEALSSRYPGKKFAAEPEELQNVGLLS